MSITDLSEYRRRRDAVPRVVTDHIISKDLNDYCTVYFICHERRDVVQAGIAYVRAHVETFGPGGWAEFNGPYRQDLFYVANGLSVRFPDEMLHEVVWP